MSKLDRSRPFGKITPPCEMPGGARAFFDQDGKQFDQHDRLIVPGVMVRQAQTAVPVTQTEPPPPPAPRSEKPVIEMTAQEILDNIDSLGWSELQKKAKLVLGSACPPGKAAIKAALEAAIVGHAERVEKRKQTAERGATQTITPGRVVPTPDFDPPADDTAAPAAETPPPAAVKGGPVDLLAWGRGHKEYVFSEVRKAFRAQHNVVIAERWDAVEWLIDNGHLSAGEARADIKTRAAA